MQETPWLFVLSHGRVSEELLKSAEMIVGPLQNAYAFPLTADLSPEEYIAEIKKQLKRAPEGSIVFVDFFGGTPANVATVLARDYQIAVVTGFNLPMLFEADEKRKTMRAKELAEAVVAVGRENCKIIELPADYEGEKEHVS